ncbi:MATE family efflux transporter [Harryflintia acetispora]|uniref:MATE family efflux protein n=1 Tax=Harryflintia acetispora TaxID=1849041 RepID=A0A9X8Y749_9FIRM|nr:MATE family efflux transporter [Harryflintia acetispora]TCL41004.1 putative MATE family efflux protein [Harryflintia acetispora]
MSKSMRIDAKTSLFGMTWPIFIELVLQMLVGNVDQIMLSHYSDTAVAAVGNANQIINVLILMFSVVSMATTILVSQYLGAGNREKVSQIYTLAVLVNLAISLAVAAAIFLINSRMFVWMATPQELIGDATTYILINGGLIFLQGLFMTYSAIFRSNALMKESMFIAVVINLTNILGNFLLINGAGVIPALGVAGAAVSSCLSRGIGVVIMIYLFRREVGGEISLRVLRPFPGNLLKRLLLIGLPSGGESLSYNMTQMCCLAFLNMLGTAVVTTKVYAVMFSMLAYLYVTAIAQSSQIVVGHLVGAGEMDDADRRTMRTLRSSVPVSFGIALLLFLCSDFLFGLFTQNSEILRMGKLVLGVEVALEVGRALNIVLVRALQAAGDVRFPVVVGIISQWLVSVGIGYLLGIVLHWGIAGIWAAMAADECLRGTVMLIRWRSGVWRTKVQIERE